MTTSASALCYTQLDNYELIECSGPDALVFLQGQLTCDVRLLDDDKYHSSAILGSCCNVQGRMIAVFHIMKPSKDTLWFILPKNNTAQFLAHLAKYSVFSKVTITQNPHQLSLYGCWHISSQAQLSLQSDQTKYFSIAQPAAHEMTASAFVITSQPFTPNATLCKQQAWHLHWLQQGLPLYDQSLNGQFMPHELHFDWLGGVSYKKGCYTGQEPIARLHFKGVAKFECKLIEWQSLQANATLEQSTASPDMIQVKKDEKKIGALLDWVATDHGWLGLAKLRLDAMLDAKSDTELELPWWQAQAKIADLAYNKTSKVVV